MDDPDILLTNDDGVDAAGLHALHDALSSVGSVTVVAPANNQSGIGRVLSQSVTVHEHNLGYVLEGTPADCVIAGLRSLVPETDLVVAGCNRGANLGTAGLGRSGTVSAAVEAALLGVPAIAASMYIPVGQFEDDSSEIDPEEYDEAASATAYLAEHASQTDVFDRADYLNVNAPIATRSTGKMVVTRPSNVYRMDSERDGKTIILNDHIWEEMESGSTPDPPGTDRHAIIENRVSVSPLTAPHSTEIDPTLEGLADSYSGTTAERPD